MRVADLSGQSRSTGALGRHPRAAPSPTGASSTAGQHLQPHAGTSAFEQKHRFNLNATYDLNTGPFTHTSSLLQRAERPSVLTVLGTISVFLTSTRTRTSATSAHVPGIGSSSARPLDGTDRDEPVRHEDGSSTTS